MNMLKWCHKLVIILLFFLNMVKQVHIPAISMPLGLERHGDEHTSNHRDSKFGVPQSDVSCAYIQNLCNK